VYIILKTTHKIANQIAPWKFTSQAEKLVFQTSPFHENRTYRKFQADTVSRIN